MNRQEGFSLLEIIVAISIFAVISVASYSTLTTIQKVDVETAEFEQKFEKLQRAMWIMERDFMQVSLRKARWDESGDSEQLLFLEKGSGETESDAVKLIRTGWINPFDMLPRGEVQGVTYRVEEGILLREYSLYPDSPEEAELKTRELLDRVTSFKVRFHNGKKWQENWEKAGALPHAAEVSLDLEQFGLIKRVFLMTGAEVEKPKSTQASS